MSRILIAIGCNDYDHLTPLHGAVRDAEAVKNLLVGPSRYNYRDDLSVLLTSPTTGDVRKAIAELYEKRPAEILFYFAGHAESRDGRLFLKLRDTRGSDLLPPTSIPLGEILDNLSQAPGLAQLNLIIDACNAAGLRTDLAKALAERAEKSIGALSVGILAGAGPELPAVETTRGGRLTKSVCDMLDGTIPLQRWSPYLDLAQISEGIQRVPAVAAQNPSYWGINLRGANIVAPNPHFDPATAAKASPDAFFTGTVRLNDGQLEAVKGFLDALHTEGWKPVLLHPLQAALASLTIAERTSVFLSLASSVDIYERSKLNLPPDREAMLLQALLPISHDISAKTILDSVTNALIDKVKSRLADLKDQIHDRPRDLVRSGFSELYYLPIRISHVLGWIGVTLLTSNDSKVIQNMGDFARSILSEYGNSIVAVDERQSSSIFCFALGALRNDLRDEGEEVLSRLFIDLYKTNGRISRSNNDGAQKVEYLLRRYDVLYSMKNVVQRPSELLAVVLIMGAIYGMDAAWDDMLLGLDHAALNMFVNCDPIHFADEKIEAGENVTIEVGHQFSRLAELRFLIDEISATDSTLDRLSSSVLDCISLILPDRVNWPRIADLIYRKEISVHRNRLIVSSLDPETSALEILYDSAQA